MSPLVHSHAVVVGHVVGWNPRDHLSNKGEEVDEITVVLAWDSVLSDDGIDGCLGFLTQRTTQHLLVVVAAPSLHANARGEVIQCKH